MTLFDDPVLRRAKAIWAEREKGFPAFVRQTWDQGTVLARMATLEKAAQELGESPAPCGERPIGLRRAAAQVRRTADAVTAKPAGAQMELEP